MPKELVSAKVITAFPGKPDGAAQVREIAVGEVITGSLAEVAIAEKWAEPLEAKSEESPVDLDQMKVDELKAHAADRNIDLGDATKKADIIDKIKAAGA